MVLSIIIFILGLVFGSFIGALSWRLPRGKKIYEGRSVCDSCGEDIRWIDNIPVVSYFLLGGRCRYCNKKISVRYPLIELCTGLTFLLLTLFYFRCSDFVLFDSPICYWRQTLSIWALPFLIFMSSIMVLIFLIDLEYQIIPDLFVYSSLLTVFVVVFSADIYIWEMLFSGFLAASFLLMLNLVTLGKGMGLGDAKLAIPIGMMLGVKQTVSWLFMSFVIGAVIGVILIISRKAEFGKQIAFGPFMAVSFLIMLFFGSYIESFVFFY